MRRAFAAVALLASAGCRKEPEPTPVATVYEWAQQSPDKRFELRQRRDSAGCRVEAVVKPDDRLLWTSQTCLPAPSGLTFLSPDGERLLVLDLFPSAQVAQGPDWSHVPLISYWAQGAVVRQYTGSEVLSAARVTDMRKVLSWVRGDTFEEAHSAARASSDGSQVTVALVDGRSLTLSFDGAALAAPPSEPTAERAAEPASAAGGGPPAAAAAADRRPDPMAVDEQRLYRWEDDQGELHFGAGAQVPPRYRKRARPVSASVGVMPLDRPPAEQVQPQPGRPVTTQVQVPATSPAQAQTPPAPAEAPAEAQPAAPQAQRPDANAPR